MIPLEDRAEAAGRRWRLYELGLDTDRMVEREYRRCGCCLIETAFRLGLEVATVRAVICDAGRDSLVSEGAE